MVLNYCLGDRLGPLASPAKLLQVSRLLLLVLALEATLCGQGAVEESELLCAGERSASSVALNHHNSSRVCQKYVPGWFLPVLAG